MAAVRPKYGHVAPAEEVPVLKRWWPHRRRAWLARLVLELLVLACWASSWNNDEEDCHDDKADDHGEAHQHHEEDFGRAKRQAGRRK